MLISLIIPAYNESTRIRRTLDQYVKDFYPGNKEIVVVPNGCTDNTLEVVQQAQKELGSEIVIHNLKEGGKGLAVQEGFKIAKGELVGFVDADGATSPTEYKKLVEAILHDKYDGAIASRWLKGAKVVGRTSPLRTVVSQGFHIINKLLFWLPVRDTQCGAKIFKNEVIKEVIPKLRVKNMAFDVELLLVAKKSGFRYKEVPTVWVDQSSSEMLGSPGKVFKTSINMFVSLIKVRLHHLFK